MLSRIRSRKLRDYSSNRFELVLKPDNEYSEEHQLSDEEDMDMSSGSQSKIASKPSPTQHPHHTRFKRRKQENGTSEHHRLSDEEDMDRNSTNKTEEESLKGLAQQHPHHTRFKRRKNCESSRRKSNGCTANSKEREIDNNDRRRTIDLCRIHDSDDDSNCNSPSNEKLTKSQCDSSTTVKLELNNLLKKIDIPFEICDRLKSSVQKMMNTKLSEQSNVIEKLTAERNESKEQIKKLLDEKEDIPVAQVCDNDKKMERNDLSEMKAYRGFLKSIKDEDLRQKVAQLITEKEKHRHELMLKNNSYNFLQKEFVKTVVEKDEARDELLQMQEEHAKCDNNKETATKDLENKYATLYTKHDEVVKRYHYDKEQASQYLNKLKNEVNEYHNRYVQLKNSHETLTKDLSQMSSASRQQYDTYTRENNMLRESYELLRQKFNSFSEDFAANKEQLRILTHDRDKQRYINREVGNLLRHYGLSCGTRQDLDSDLKKLTETRNAVSAKNEKRVANDDTSNVAHINYTESAATSSSTVDTSESNLLNGASNDLNCEPSSESHRDIVSRGNAANDDSKQSASNMLNSETSSEPHRDIASIGNATNVTWKESLSNSTGNNESNVTDDIEVDATGRQIITFLENDLKALIKNVEYDCKESNQKKINNTNKLSKAGENIIRPLENSAGGKDIQALRASALRTKYLKKATVSPDDANNDDSSIVDFNEI